MLVLVLAWAVHSAPGRGLEPLVARTAQQRRRGSAARCASRHAGGAAGRRRVEMPSGWNETAGKLLASSNAEVRQKTLLLSVLFGDQKALASLRRTVGDAGADADTCRSALQTLVEVLRLELLGLLRGHAR